MFLLRLRLAFAAFFVVIVGGTCGYRFIGGWSWLDSIWMVVITLTTIGYSESQPLSDVGRLFTLGLIFAGVGLTAFSISQFTRYFLDGELAARLKLRRRKRIMERLQGHYVVIGLGRLGREVCEELRHRGYTLVAVDKEHADEDAAFASDVAMYITGDGTSDNVLKAAAIERAAGVAVATGSDATNIFVTLSARQLNPDLHIVTRVDGAASVDKAIRAGANLVVDPFGIIGARMAQGLVHPNAAQLMDRVVGRRHEEFEIEDIAIGSATEYHGALGDLDIPTRHKVQLLAVRRPDGEMVTTLDRTTELRAGDIAIVVGQRSDIRAFSSAVRN